MDKENKVLIKNITHGKIYNKNQYEKLFLSEDLPKNTDESEFFLVIYAVSKKLTRITCYPITTPRILKIKIVLEGINEKIGKALTDSYGENILVHTTGIKKYDMNYKVENYIHLKKGKDQLDIINQNLATIEEIKNYILTEIEK